MKKTFDPSTVASAAAGTSEPAGLEASRAGDAERPDGAIQTVGVVLVTYNGADIIGACLDSLAASQGAHLRVVVVDNRSQDDTVAAVRAWKAANEALDQIQLSLELIVSDQNHGFAGGVNLGIRHLLQDPDLAFFWILNPDCRVEPLTAARLVARAGREGRFGIIGGRIFYSDPPDMIQSDGGRVNFMTGVCVPFNMTALAGDARPPKDESLDYFTGAHLFVSRIFIETVGLMREDYFLYFEEVDWCLRRGDLRLIFDADAVVHHEAGHSIGSASVKQGPSLLSAYFLNRSRRMFMLRFRPLALPIAMAYGSLRALRDIARGEVRPGLYALRGLWGLPPTRVILGKIGRDRLT